MATATGLSLNVTHHGVTTTIPDDDVARLMYYLHSVTFGVGLDILQDDLISYKQYYLLSPARIAVVFKTAVELKPEEFIGKVIFRDDAGDVTGASSNKFITITAAADVISIQRNVIVAGRATDVTKVMFFKSIWLKTYYTDPIERIARAILGTNHCNHCQGDEGICACTSCPRGDSAKCRPLFNAFLEALVTPVSPRPASPQPPPRQIAPNQHQANCDGCGWRTFSGDRYKCTVCADYDLCQACYDRNVHLDTSHTFMKIRTPGARPDYLSLRYESTPPPYTPPSPATKPPLPPRTTPSYPTPAKPPVSSNTWFYQDMSPAELKSYLTERGVSFDDILDKETLCRRVWDTHCDCMTIPELNQFFTDNSISTADCRDIASKRARAKAAFRPPARPPAPTPAPAPAMPKDGGSGRTTGGGPFRKDDAVILHGLTRAEMNGKKGTIVLIDVAASKATVKVPDLDRSFKVKFENIKFDDDDEELE